MGLGLVKKRGRSELTDRPLFLDMYRKNVVLLMVGVTMQLNKYKVLTPKIVI